SLLKRMVLVKPGLGERLIAELEEEPHIDRITARHDEVELGAPMAVNAVGYRFSDLVVGEGPARAPQYRLRHFSVGEGCKWASQELDGEFADALRPGLAGLAAVPEPRCHAARQGARIGLIGQPVQLVAEVEA